MVTETIKQEDIHPRFMIINKWIINGISTSAGLTVLTAWNQINGANINIYDVKNKSFYVNNIQPVNKW